MLWKDRCSFYLAVQKNDLEAAGQLIKRGLDVDIRYKVGSLSKPVLSICAQRGHVQMAKLLIQAGCNVNQTDNAGWAPVHLACVQRRDEMIDLLITHGACVNQTNVEKNNTLHLAVIGGASLAIIQKLVDAGSNLNPRNSQGATPLVLACVQGNTDCVRYLISKGASVNLQDAEGNTALIHATQFSGSETLKIILSAGSAVNTQNKDGLGPLHAAVLNCHKDNMKIVEALIDAGCNLDATTQLGQTALHLAVLQHKYPAVELLTRAGASLDVRDKLGHRTLYSVARAGQRRHARLMVDAGLDLRGEPWLVDADPVARDEVKDAELVAWLRESAVAVPTLMHSCRVTLRRHLGRRADRLAADVPLPLMLQRYLRMEV